MYLLQETNQNNQTTSQSTPLSEEQVNAIKDIYDLYSVNKSLRQQNINKFNEEWDKEPNLKIVKEWWNKIDVDIQLTSVGKVLAHSNAQRCDENLPPLD